MDIDVKTGINMAGEELLDIKRAISDENVLGKEEVEKIEKKIEEISEIIERVDRDNSKLNFIENTADRIKKDLNRAKESKPVIIDRIEIEHIIITIEIAIVYLRSFE